MFSGLAWGSKFIPIFDSFPNGIENVSLFFLKRNDKIRPQDNADQLRFDGGAVPVKLQHFEHDKNIIIASLHFGALPGIENVFQDERMNVEMRANFFKNVYLVKPVDIDPTDRRPVSANQGFFDGFGFLFFILPDIIIEN